MYNIEKCKAIEDIGFDAEVKVNKISLFATTRLRATHHSYSKEENSTIFELDWFVLQSPSKAPAPAPAPAVAADITKKRHILDSQNADRGLSHPFRGSLRL